MSDDEQDYEVGYGKPPKHTQFQKGKSGNPKGRPRGAKGIAASLRRELDSSIVVKEGGKQQRISKAQAVAKRAVGKALGGDMAALRLLITQDADLRGTLDMEGGATPSNSEPDLTDKEVVDFFAQICRKEGVGALPLANADLDEGGDE